MGNPRGLKTAPLPAPGVPRGKKRAAEDQRDLASSIGTPGKRPWLALLGSKSGSGEAVAERPSSGVAPLCRPSPAALPLTRVEAVAPKLNKLSCNSNRYAAPKLPSPPLPTPFSTGTPPPAKAKPTQCKGKLLSLGTKCCVCKAGRD